MPASPRTAKRSESVAGWLVENGTRELEQLFRAIVCQRVLPILIADDDLKWRDVSAGAARLLGVPREKLVGRPVEAFAPANARPEISQLWQALKDKGEQEGTLSLVGADAEPREVEYTAKGNVLPERHVLALRDKSLTADGIHEIPAWVQDYALFLLDEAGCIAAWYAGSGRIYGYSAAEAIGEYVSFLYTPEDPPRERLEEELRRAAAEGHFGSEGWQVKKTGVRFWANTITMAVKDTEGQLRGFARVVRDFSERHERDEKLRKDRSRPRPILGQTTVAGIVSGEFDRISEANDAFLELVGHTREDLMAGRIGWPDLTPPEFAALDDLAHEEGLRFSACTPYEKELMRPDGKRVPVLIATAVLNLVPFHWITFVQDLRERDRIESVERHESEGEFGEIVGTSSALRRVQQQVELVAPTDANVLILGETGTGKELVARAIHRLSPRRNMPFITLNCAAIPTGLLESELFGYERGAFTGALQQKIGRFEMAHRGTLFLDEVGDIPLDLQPKLLRALQEKAFERLGGTRTIPIDVRLVAATNRNLLQMMGDRLFRSDLYYRLKVFPITTPPLRDRQEDVPVLARYFTKKYAARMNRDIDKIPAETMSALVSWSWPGNVRELENFIERSVILSRGPALRAPLSELREDQKTSDGSEKLEDVERGHILRVLRESDGVITTAASRLGLHRTTLNSMMRKLGISRRDL